MLFVFLFVCLLLAIVPSWAFIYYLLSSNKELVKAIGAMSASRYPSLNFLPMPREDILSALDDKVDPTSTKPEGEVKKPTGQYL